MKGMKKLLSILMVLTLVLSLGATAFASGDLDMTPAEGRDAKQVVVTLPEQYNTHKMVAYQIFTGAQKAGDDVSAQDQLGVTGWAAGVNSAALLQELSTTAAYAGKFNTGMNAVAAAKAIQELNLSGTAAYDFATIVAKHVTQTGTTFNNEGEKPSATLGSGYWIIIDETEPAPETGFAYSAYLLQVVGDEGQIPVTPKFDVPSVDKQVADQNDSKTDPQSWGEVADWDINDTVPFKITATMPSTLEGYKTYKLVFHDTMSAGLTLIEDSITLKVSGKDAAIDKSNYQVETGTAADGGTTITITIENALADTIGATVGSEIVVEYNATLNDKAVIGGTGNPNTVYLEYSNNPNGEGTGKTPEDKVTVFTFSLDVDKVQPDGEGKTKPLAGAGFTLYKYDADAASEDKWVQVGKEVTVAENGSKYTASFKGLDQGKYKLVESTVPAGYNKADDIEFTVEATYSDETGENTTVVTLTIKDGAGTVISGGDHEGKTFGISAVEGEFYTQVLNSSGLELPETGGIGTTIFYVAGAVLAAAAVVLLVTKRRVNGAEK